MRVLARCFPPRISRDVAEDDAIFDAAVAAAAASEEDRARNCAEDDVRTRIDEPIRITRLMSFLSWLSQSVVQLSDDGRVWLHRFLHCKRKQAIVGAAFEAAKLAEAEGVERGRQEDVRHYPTLSTPAHTRPTSHLSILT